MRLFTGQFERTIDAKNRIQLPSPLRGAIDPETDGDLVYVTFGEHRGTLSLFTERAFNELASRSESEFKPTREALQFELQFYGLTAVVELDKQGRFVLPERLLKKARLGPEIVLVGQGNRIDIWNPGDLERSLGINWDGDDWPDLLSFRRNRPSNGKGE